MKKKNNTALYLSLTILALIWAGADRDRVYYLAQE